MDELSAWLTLARAPSLHAGTLAPLFHHFPDAATLIAAPPAALRAAGLDAKSTQWLVSPPHDAIARDRRWLECDAHHFIQWGAPGYPPLLRTLGDAPVGLFVRGDPAALMLPQLAIVGSRNPTPTGRENAHRFGGELAHAGLAVTSGLAIGIDTAAHQGALDAGGLTIAVCGAGLDIVYPRANAELAEAIAAQGALVSEFAPGTPAVKLNFPRRNRLISGLSLGTLVIEAALCSGSLITARLAAEQGREVFALPGSIHNALAQGCHRLIQNGAKLVTGVDDIFVELRALLRACPAAGADIPALRAATTPQPPDAPGNMSSPLDKEYEILLDALGFEPAGVDLLVARTGLKADEVASMLLRLELAERVESFPGGLYVRAHAKAVK